MLIAGLDLQVVAVAQVVAATQVVAAMTHLLNNQLILSKKIVRVTQDDVSKNKC